MLAAFPLLVLPVAFYNILMLTISGGFTGAGAGARLSTPLVNLHMVSRALWPVSLGDLSLSMLLFIICLVEFLLFPAFATSTFFLIGLMVLLDVAAGFIVTLIASRR